MHKYLLPIIFGILCGLGVKTFILKNVGVKPAAIDRNWNNFNYKVFDRDFQGDLDIKISAKLPDGVKDPAFRLVLAYADKDNYSAVDFSARKAVFRRSSGGVVLQEIETDFSWLDCFAGEEKKGFFRVRYHAPDLKFIADKKIAAVIRDVRLLRGRAGIGSKKGNIELQKPEILQIEPIAFRDDFMRGVKDVSLWQSSSKDWQVRSIENPSRSSNAFVYYCKSKEGSLSVLGREHWDNYQVSASFFGSFKTQAGIVFAGKDKKNYMLFRWCSEADEREAEGKVKNEESDKEVRTEEENPLTQGSMQLIKVTDGKEEILAEKKQGYQPNRWYRLSVKCGEGIVETFIDNIKVMQAEDNRISGGRAGLFARGESPVEFDDFKVKSAVFPERRLAGSESITAETLKRISKSSQTAFPVIFNSRLSGFSVKAQLKPDSGAGFWRARLIPVFIDALSYYSFEVNTGKNKLKPEVRLFRVENGRKGTNLLKETVEYSADLPLQTKFKSGILTLSQQQRRIFTASTGYRLAGAGIAELSACSLSGLDFKQLDYSLPVASINQVFDEETLMKSWSSHGGDWRKADSGPYDAVYWHRAYFFGETEIEALLFNTGKGEGNVSVRSSKPEVLLSLAKPVGSGKKGNGYTFKYKYNKKQKQQHLELMKNGKSVIKKNLEDTLMANRLRFRRSGPILTAYLDDEPVLEYEDSEPLQGRKTAWAVKGISVPPGNVRVYNDNLKSYSFNSAPVDWIIGSGVWEVTNRWECDPRWSFWSGMPAVLAEKRIKALDKYFSERSSWKIANLEYQLKNIKDKKDRHVVLWHKENFGGDLLAEFYVGQMMDRSRGNYSKYVRDFNITIASEGKDLLSGYSCILGGWKNKKSALLRNGEVVLEKGGNFLNKGNVHRRWIRVRVTRSGNAIRFTADYETKPGTSVELLDLYYVDKEPLKGKRIALWSYDCGVLIGRFRVSAEKITLPDDPFEYNIFTSKSIYSKAN
ncbi:MAG: hypothetical protein ACYTFY_02750 [Planctomycetota bacterium]|jgi:hypothetical protein